MSNHKRRRPKHQRAGCLWCKPHKDERALKEPRQPTISEAKLLDEVDEYWGGKQRRPPTDIDTLFDTPRRPKDRRHNCGGKTGLEHVPVWERRRHWSMWRLVLRCERCGKLLGQERRLPRVA